MLNGAAQLSSNTNTPEGVILSAVGALVTAGANAIGVGCTPVGDGDCTSTSACCVDVLVRVNCISLDWAHQGPVHNEQSSDISLICVPIPNDD